MENREKESQKEPTVREDLDEEEINLLDYIRVIFKYRRMILWICGIAIVTTVIISLLLPEIYSATTTIVPPTEILQKGSGLAEVLGGGESSISLIVGEAIDVKNIVNMYVGILESRVVADAIIDRFDLLQIYDVKERSEARNKLRKNTTATASRENIVRITVEDRDPNRAAAMANAYVEELDRQNKRLSTGQATSKIIFLENRLKEIEEKLSKKENILSREAKIQEMLFELLTREYELAKIEEAKSLPTIQVLDRAVVPEKKSKPKRRQMVMLSGIVALFIAIFAAFGREYFAKVNAPPNKGVVNSKSA